MKVTVRQLYRSTVAALCANYSTEEAKMLASRLFEHFLQLKPAERVMAGDQVLDDVHKILIDSAIKKILHFMPIQYVTGSALFLDLDLEVNSSVLIPRPETEELVTKVIKHIETNQNKHSLKILDIGTGSGCIAIALKYYLPEIEVFACDISDEALEVARRNAKKYEALVNFLNINILDRSSWDQLPDVDIIVSNPPYVTESEKQQMEANVLNYEPHTALFVPDKEPLLFYEAIAEYAFAKLNRGGSIWFEINENYGSQAKEMLLAKGFTQVNIFSDFHEKERFLQASKLI